jgi:hypothetical protein
MPSVRICQVHNFFNLFHLLKSCHKFHNKICTVTVFVYAVFLLHFTDNISLTIHHADSYTLFRAICLHHSTQTAVAFGPRNYKGRKQNKKIPKIVVMQLCNIENPRLHISQIEIYIPFKGNIDHI